MMIRLTTIIFCFLIPSTILAQNNNELSKEYVSKFKEVYNKENASLSEIIEAKKDYLLEAYKITPTYKTLLITLIVTDIYLEDYESAIKWINEIKKTDIDQEKYNIDEYESLCKEKINEQRVLASRSTRVEVSTNIEFTMKGRQLYKREFKPTTYFSELSPAKKNEESYIINKLSEYSLNDPYIEFPFLVYTTDSRSADEHYKKGVLDFYSFFKKTIFETDPEYYITILIGEYPNDLTNLTNQIYKESSFQEYDAFLGFFNPSDNLIVSTGGNVGYGTLLHEMMHALIFQDDTGPVPFWKNEGFASLYERSMWKDNYLKPLANWRFDQYKHVTLDLLISQMDNDSANLNNVKMLLLFLEENMLLKEFYYKTKTTSVKDFITSKELDESDFNEYKDQILSDYYTELSLSNRTSDFSSEEIKIFQSALKATIDENIKVDGIWGTKSTEALIKFQEKFGLSSDGVIGRNTKKKLYEAGLAEVD